MDLINPNRDSEPEFSTKIKEEHFDIELQAKVLRMKKKMLMKENKLLSDNTITLNSILENQDSLILALKNRNTEEMNNLEYLQTKFYDETVKMANLCEDIDKTVDFLEEFVQIASTTKIKRDTDLKLPTFRKLHSEDRGNINDLMSSLGISFS